MSSFERHVNQFPHYDFGQTTCSFGTNGLLAVMMSLIPFEDILAAEPIDFSVAGNCLLANRDLNGPVDVDFVGDENKWVIDAYGRFCWYRTAARFLAVTSRINLGVGKPVPLTAVTEAQFNKALPKILIFAAIGHILETHRTCPHAPELVVRVTDAFNNDAWTSIAVPDSGLRMCEILIAQWWSKARERAEVAQEVARRVKMLGALAVANALIRHETGGRNFITEDLDKSSSATFRALDVGGENKGQFTDFVKDYNVGKDVWHPLNDQSLENLVDSITGHNRIRLPHVNNAPGVTFKYHIGVNCAAISKWPLPVLSIPAIHIGLTFCREMLSDICGRQGVLVLRNGARFDHNAAIDAIAARISLPQFNREELLSLRSNITPTIVIASGYASSRAKGRDIIESSPVITKVCKANTEKYDSGKRLFSQVQRKMWDPVYLRTAIIQPLANVVAEQW